MTRAREKLYITGNLYKPESKIKEIYDRFYTGDEQTDVALSLASNFLQWSILTAIQHPSAYEMRKELGIMNCNSRTTNSKIDFAIVQAPVFEEISEIEEVEKAPVDKLILDTINKKVNYKYPYADFASMPIKYSASRVDENAGVLYVATENPAFMGKDELTPAQRGTLAHKFLEKCDFTFAEEIVENEIARLINEGVFTENEADSQNINSIKNFIASDLFKRIKSAEKFIREKQFTMTAPLSFVRKDLPEGAEKESVVLQGIMDGLIINGNTGEIIDYKTDRVETEEELCDRYREQMRVYKAAAEQCFGLENVTVTLYSFSLSKEISIKL